MNTRIKKLRQQLNLTQEAFAKRIGMKQNSIALIESGKRNISEQAILSICREFGVNEEWLKTGKGDMLIPANNSALDALANEKKLSKSERILIEKFVELKPEVRQGILSYMTAVAAALVSEKSATSVSVNEPDFSLPTVEEAEAEYIKSISNSAPKRSFSASSTIKDTKTEKQA